MNCGAISILNYDWLQDRMIDVAPMFFFFIKASILPLYVKEDFTMNSYYLLYLAVLSTAYCQIRLEELSSRRGAFYATFEGKSYNKFNIY